MRISFLNNPIIKFECWFENSIVEPISNPAKLITSESDAILLIALSIFNLRISFFTLFFAFFNCP